VIANSHVSFVLVILVIPPDLCVIVRYIFPPGFAVFVILYHFVPVEVEMVVPLELVVMVVLPDFLLENQLPIFGSHLFIMSRLTQEGQ
jgi:hypothetical protein